MGHKENITSDIQGNYNFNKKVQFIVKSPPYRTKYSCNRIFVTSGIVEYPIGYCKDTPCKEFKIQRGPWRD